MYLLRLILLSRQREDWQSPGWPQPGQGVGQSSKGGATGTHHSHLAVHLARHLGEGGTVSELWAPSDEGEDGFAVNEEHLPPVAWRGNMKQSQLESLRTWLWLYDKLVAIGTADAIRVDLVQVDPFAVGAGVDAGSGRDFLLCWSGERNAVQSSHCLSNIFSKVEIFIIFSIPCTGYRMFCQCNCCNLWQISSLPSLQTHRSSGCQRWGIVCGFRPCNSQAVRGHSVLARRQSMEKLRTSSSYN